MKSKSRPRSPRAAAAPIATVDLTRRHARCGLTGPTVASHQEAAYVTLARCGAKPPRSACVLEERRPRRAARTRRGELRWSSPTKAMRDSHANEQDAVRDAAYAVAVPVALDLPGYETWCVRRQAPVASGSDWLLEDPNAPDEVVRLEVSGIAGVDDVNTRVRIKVQQLKDAPWDDPGVALVVKFSATPIEVVAATVPA